MRHLFIIILSLLLFSINGNAEGSKKSKIESKLQTLLQKYNKVDSLDKFAQEFYPKASKKDLKDIKKSIF